MLDKSFELWRNDEVSQFTSSPTLIDGVAYQVTLAGLLFAVDIETGETLWKEKLGADQLHASPLVSGDRLYITTATRGSPFGGVQSPKMPVRDAAS